MVNNIAPCDDGSECTYADSCSGGSCVAGPGLICDDDDICTDDGCDPETGCTYVDNTAPCTDGSQCTVGDTCALGECVPGPAPDCDDENECTDDLCNRASGCVNVDNTDPCDDGSVCTDGDVCGGGACVPGPALDCADDNPCTDDLCDDVMGCQNPDNTAPCEDGDLCTEGDVCALGVCVTGTVVDCDDENPCTDETCIPATGCDYQWNSEPCDDHSVCTTTDECVFGECQPGPAIVCNDGDPCTNNTCDPILGCQDEPTSGNACDDDDPCTDNDVCLDGVCESGGQISCPSPTDCRLGYCKPNGSCGVQNAPDGTPCNADGNWECDSGTCVCTPSCVAVGECGSDGCGGLCPCDNGNACVDGCADQAYAGDWWVEADPDWQDGIDILDEATFVAFMMAITLGLGDEIHGEAVTGPSIDYDGEITDPDFWFTASYSDGFIDYEEVWDCTFDSQTEFTCLVTVDIYFFFYIDTIFWDVTGTKQ